MTQAQQQILALLQRANTHLTAEQVHTLVRKEHPSVSLSTVYRNLTQFADTGKIRRIRRAGSQDCFEGNLTPHDHAYCVLCGRVSDLRIPSLKGFLKEHFNHPILSFDLLVNYVCPDCETQSQNKT